MDTAYISALAALAGSALGGLTTFATAWITMRSQMQEKRTEAERSKREDLYGAFMTTAAGVYADAVHHEREQVEGLVELYALVGRIRLSGSPAVIQQAEDVIQDLVDTYLAPNISLRELRERMKTSGQDPLRLFSEACRDELWAVSNRFAGRGVRGR